MKKLTVLILFIIFSILSVCAEETKLLTAQISMVPQSFYGTWRVLSKRIETDSPSVFKTEGLDVWNLSHTYDVITLCNPFNGAKAEITVSRADNNYIIFTKTGKYDTKILSDRVELNLEGDKFTGINTLQLDTYSQGKLVKSESAKYSLKGEKIGGGVVVK